MLDPIYFTRTLAIMLATQLFIFVRRDIKTGRVIHRPTSFYLKLVLVDIVFAVLLTLLIGVIL